MDSDELRVLQGIWDVTKQRSRRERDGHGKDSIDFSSPESVRRDTHGVTTTE